MGTLDPSPQQKCLATSGRDMRLHPPASHLDPSPPRPKWPSWEKPKFTAGKVLLGHCWYTHFWVSEPPPPLPPLLLLPCLPPPFDPRVLHRSVSSEASLTLDASNSIDQDDDPSVPIDQGDPTRRYSWSFCYAWEGRCVAEAYLFNDTNLTNSSVTLVGTEDNPLPPGRYLATVTITRFGRSTSASVEVDVQAGAVPSASIRWLQTENRPVSPAAAARQTHG